MPVILWGFGGKCTWVSFKDFTKYHECGTLFSMKRPHETVGDVEAKANALIAVHGLRTVGGTFYPHIKP